VAKAMMLGLAAPTRHVPPQNQSVRHVAALVLKTSQKRGGVEARRRGAVQGTAYFLLQHF